MSHSRRRRSPPRGRRSPPPYIVDDGFEEWYMNVPLPQGQMDDSYSNGNDNEFQKWYGVHCRELDEYVSLFKDDPRFRMDRLGNIDYETLESIGLQKKAHIKWILKKIKQYLIAKRNLRKDKKKKSKRIQDDHITPPSSIDNY